MLFLMRSAVCIGLVASALPDHALPSATEGVAALEALCHSDAARCRTIVGTLLTGDAERAAARPRKLRDQPAAEPSRLSRPAQVL